MKRPELEKELDAAGLLGKKGCCGDRFPCCFQMMLVDPALLDNLYEGMECAAGGMMMEQKGCKTF
tara:strand:+ start:1186 stop:1380 length:195 start_codon:yes stop_codon:yes gene_type:complete